MRARSIQISSVILCVVAAACGPKVGPPPTRIVKNDPNMVERGRYLANHVTRCVSCHSKQDFTKAGAPVVAGTEGAGGEILTKAEHNVPGSIPVPNITPAALSSWSDGDIIHAITAGVSKDGHALFPVMPYPTWRTMPTEDVDAIVAYVRSLDAKPSKVVERSLNFPLGIIVNSMPKEAEPQAFPAPSDTVATGAYLATIAGCLHCHSQEKRGVYKEGYLFAGGHPFRRGEFKIFSPNITPHEKSGIGSWSKEAFVARFAAYRDVEVSGAPRAADGPTYTEMPWGDFSGMTDADLGAIYDFLRTTPAVDNTIERFQKWE